MRAGRFRQTLAPKTAVLWLGCAAVVVAGSARADSFRMPPLKAGKAVSIQGYGAQNPACLEWTNGCVLCVMNQGQAQCSTPGIACTPAGLTCRRRAP